MFPVATSAQMKELYRAAKELGVSTLKSLEQAAFAVAGAVSATVTVPRDGSSIPKLNLAHLASALPAGERQQRIDALQAVLDAKKDDPAPRVAVFCGPGGNGAIGLTAARFLRKDGYRVRTFLVGDRAGMAPGAAAAARQLEEEGGAVEPSAFLTGDKKELPLADQETLAWLSVCDCYVDALYGAGRSKPVEGAFQYAIWSMNLGFAPVVACDVPSGLHADTGAVLGYAVKAAVTVTFNCGKPGLYLGDGPHHAGEVIIACTVPRHLTGEMILWPPDRVELVQPDDFRIPRRHWSAHKGDFGKVFILAGSVGYTGAPVLAASAAVRTGAGLVYLGVPKDIYPIVAVKCTEAMPFPLPERYEDILERAKRCGVALIGPGLGRAPETEEPILRLLADLDIPVVLDADGINALSGHIDVLDKRSAPTVLTPHEGEFARLTGTALPIHDRLAAARDFAKAHRCTLVLKGHGTVTASPVGRCRINTTGNPGMAKGGSGDVLAGIIAALLAQKPLWGRVTDEADLAAAGVYWHGEAGDRAAEKLGEYGMTPSDLLSELPGVLRDHTERNQTI